MLFDSPIQPVSSDLHRQWMADDYFDLIVWHDASGQIHGFQLCYNKPGEERALTWTRDNGFTHALIDRGESKASDNRTPILVAGGTFPSELVKAQFIARSEKLSPEIRDLVLARLENTATPNKFVAKTKATVGRSGRPSD